MASHHGFPPAGPGWLATLPRTGAENAWRPRRRWHTGAGGRAQRGWYGPAQTAPRQPAQWRRGRRAAWWPAAGPGARRGRPRTAVSAARPPARGAAPRARSAAAARSWACAWAARARAVYCKMPPKVCGR
ncbi:MAG: hypothetical protein EPO57_08725 [Chitinophagaceae bacterium]|nr:MAG: hypothetical protein EPO57_08725 [Chitinophagaceae bacterium]